MVRVRHLSFGAYTVFPESYVDRALFRYTLEWTLSRRFAAVKMQPVRFSWAVRRLSIRVDCHLRNIFPEKWLGIFWPFGHMCHKTIFPNYYLEILVRKIAL